MKQQIKAGDKIYYTGDMANIDGWFTVVEVKAAGQWNPEAVELMEIQGQFRALRLIPMHTIGHVYAGHCGTRFVTEAAHRAYREEVMAKLEAAAAPYRAKLAAEAAARQGAK